MMFKDQAEICRRQANDFVGRPEAPFLLRVANAFDELAVNREAGLISRRDRGSSLKSASSLTA
jgi:hypothetical protein